MSSDERRCAAGQLCRGHTVTNGERQPAQLTTPVGLCESCQRWVGAALRALPGDWCKLKLTIGESRASVSGGGRRPKPGSRVPLNVSADELMRHMVLAAWDAGSHVAGELSSRWDWVRRPRSSAHDYRLLVAAELLVSPNVRLLAANQDGVRTALFLGHLHRRATQHLGETLQRERQHLPCPSCGAQALVKEVQDRRGRESVAGVQTPEVIRCLACDGGPNRDGTWTEAEYQWLSRMVLDEREEIAVLKWLLAQAEWERDMAAWLAAERYWVLGYVAGVLNIENDPGLASADGLIDRVRGTMVTA